jgi:nicotinate phosphoribosyltransferase
MHPARSPLLTDLYELTMLQTYYEQGMDGEAVFELFFRASHSQRPFFIAAGVDTLVDWLENLQFSEAELDWIRHSGKLSAALADRLRGFRFTGSVDALPEGTLCLPEEPVVRIRAPLPEAQLIESRLMNIVHFQTLIASKAARCRIAAADRGLVDFGLRRAHGAEAALWAARSCYLAGFDATATVLAAPLYGIPITGTMAHSFVLAHGDETLAFERFARSHPDNTVLLIDTYDVERGARRAVEVMTRLRHDGIPFHGVRIDSGDLAAHSRRVRRILDDAGFRDTRILVSGGLEETAIDGLVRSGAPVSGFGVGSQVDTSSDQAFLNCAYKLHRYDGRDCGKRSEGKADLPGVKQIYRRFHPDGTLAGDVLALEQEILDGTPLLEPFMRAGKRLRQTDLAGARERCRRNLETMPGAWRRFLREPPCGLEQSEGVRRLARQMTTPEAKS